MQSDGQNEELRILLALEPLWTVSINGANGTEFTSVPASEIEVNKAFIRFGKYRRRILDIEWLRPNVPRLRTQTKLRAQTDFLTFYPGSILPPGIDVRRRRRLFQKQLVPALAGYFKCPIPVKFKGNSGTYSQFMLGNRTVLAVDAEESTPVIQSIMRAAILASNSGRQHMAVVVPAQRSSVIVTRLQAMPKIRAAFDWLQWDGNAIAPLDMNRPVCETHVHPYVRPGVDIEVARICALAPELLQAMPHIPGNAISIRLRGLEVARVAESGTTYPMGEPLLPLIEMLAEQRRYGSRHQLARAYEERWLESNLIRQIHDLVPVRRDCIYPQVPSFVGEDRNIIDLLAMTENGRLVVIEVKVSADPDLPFQAFDYWLAVERHRKAGDFQARGYFDGKPIRDEAALLMVVAPLLSYHRTLDMLAATLPRSVPWLQIGISQSWKREIKILRRKGALG